MLVHGAAVAAAEVAASAGSGWTTLAFATGGSIIVALIGAYAVISGRERPDTTVARRLDKLEGRVDEIEDHIRPWPEGGPE